MVSMNRRVFMLTTAAVAASELARVGGSLPTASAQTSDRQVIEFSDFTTNQAGIYRSGGSLVGKGVDVTTYQMKPGTSTKASQIPAQSTGDTNNFNLMRIGGLDSSHRATDIEVGKFTLKGTDQGHLYNGLVVGYSTGAHVHDLKVIGIPGSASSPPGETDSMGLWHADNAVVDNLTIDGLTVAATLFTINTCSGVTVNGYVGNHAIHGMSTAIWDSTNVTFDHPDFRNCRHPVNLEQSHAGTMRFIAPDMRGQTDRGPAITCNSNKASTQLIIEEPQWDLATYGPLRIGVSSAPYMGKPQRQKVSDVHVIINGTDVSGDARKVLIGDYW